jgi:PIN domain
MEFRIDSGFLLEGQASGLAHRGSCRTVPATMAKAGPGAIFLDTQVFEGASFNYQTKTFGALDKHLAEGDLQLVITDITVREVHARILVAVAKELELQRKFRDNARVLKSATGTAIAAALAKQDATAIASQLQKAFDDYLSKNDAEIIDTSKLVAGPVLAKYFAQVAPFGPGEKRKEFPDAFVVEALAAWQMKDGSGLFVVSADELFRKACGERAGLHPEKELRDVLDQVVTDEKLAEFVREQLSAQAATIAHKAKTDFEGLGFHVEDEWGDAEVSVTDIKLDEEPDILEIDESTATAHMIFKAQYDAELSYDDSTTGIYDSEEKQMLFMDHVTKTVSDEFDLVVQVEVTFDGLKPRAFQVVSVDLVEPSRGFGIPTSGSNDYR